MACDAPAFDTTGADEEERRDPEQQLEDMSLAEKDLDILEEQVCGFGGLVLLSVATGLV